MRRFGTALLGLSLILSGIPAGFASTPEKTVPAKTIAAEKKITAKKTTVKKTAQVKKAATKKTLTKAVQAKAVETVTAQPKAAAEISTKPLLTNDEALRLAYQNNPTLKAAGSRIDQAKARIDQAKANELPTLYAAFQAQRADKDTKIPVYLGNGQSIGYALNDFDKFYKAAVGFQWLLFSSGVVQHNITARQMAFRAVESKEVRTGQAVEDAVLISYYNLQRARAKRAVALEILNLTKEHLTQVESFFKFGVVARNEVLRVQVDVSNGELNVIAATNSVDVAWRALERAVGCPLEKEYSMPEPENRAIVDPKASVWNDNNLYSYRPELKALDYSIKAARALAAAAAGGNGPKVVISGQWYGAGREMWPTEQDNWVLSLGIRWDFYDGGLSQAQKREALASAQELLSNVKDFKNQVAMEVSSAQLNFSSAQQRMNVASNQVASAQEDYRMALLRYRSNVGTNLDVLDARTALSNARTQLVDAVYDTYSGQANLRYALGRSDKFMLKELVVEPAVQKQEAKK